MGSGSSKSKGRTIKICSKELLEPPVTSRSSRTTTVTCEQKKGDNNKVTSSDKNGSEMGRLIPVDPDLKLIEDILAESDDCFLWPVSTFERQMVTSCQHATTSHGPLLQVQQNQSVDNKKLQTITNKSMSEYEELQHKYQTRRDNSNTTAPVHKVLDIENNNLPKFSDTCLAPAETSAPITYDDVEEDLMDSIEKEYSHIHHITPVHYGET
ncbi:uncharacterized protein ACMZJ9_008036 [Mantella aurantiaca]